MQPASAPAGPRRAEGCATERRRGAGELLRTVTSGLSATREVARVRERFEEEVRALVRARSIAVCDGALAAPPGPNVMCVDIPVRYRSTTVRLNASRGSEQYQATNSRMAFVGTLAAGGRQAVQGGRLGVFEVRDR